MILELISIIQIIIILFSTESWGEPCRRWGAIPTPGWIQKVENLVRKSPINFQNRNCKNLSKSGSMYMTFDQKQLNFKIGIVKIGKEFPYIQKVENW